MINEIIFMEIRLLGEFCQKYRMSRAAANDLFSKHKIWQYIESCYDTFHINGDEHNLEDISNVLKTKGATKRWNAPISWELCLCRRDRFSAVC